MSGTPRFRLAISTWIFSNTPGWRYLGSRPLKSKTLQTLAVRLHFSLEKGPMQGRGEATSFSTCVQAHVPKPTFMCMSTNLVLHLWHSTAYRALLNCASDNIFLQPEMTAVCYWSRVSESKIETSRSCRNVQGFHTTEMNAPDGLRTMKIIMLFSKHF